MYYKNVQTLHYHAKKHHNIPDNAWCMEKMFIVAHSSFTLGTHVGNCTARSNGVIVAHPALIVGVLAPG